MEISQKITMDFALRGTPPRVDAVQGDTGTRKVVIALKCGGEGWQPPSGVAAVIRYRKPDGTAGTYSALPDGTAAWSLSGSELTIILSPQTLTAPGLVRLDVALMEGETVLSTFDIHLVVKPIPNAGGSEDYYSLPGYLRAPTNGEVGELLAVAAVDAAGRPSAVGTVALDTTLTASGAAAEAKAAGDALAGKLDKSGGTVTGELRLTHGLALEAGSLGIGGGGTDFSDIGTLSANQAGVGELLILDASKISVGRISYGDGALTLESLRNAPLKLTAGSRTVKIINGVLVKAGIVPETESDQPGGDGFWFNVLGTPETVGGEACVPLEFLGNHGDEPVVLLNLRVKAPASDYEPANKKYVDEKVAAAMAELQSNA